MTHSHADTHTDRQTDALITIIRLQYFATAPADEVITAATTIVMVITSGTVSIVGLRDQLHAIGDTHTNTHVE